MIAFSKFSKSYFSGLNVVSLAVSVFLVGCGAAPKEAKSQAPQTKNAESGPSQETPAFAEIKQWESPDRHTRAQPPSLPPVNSNLETRDPEEALSLEESAFALESSRQGLFEDRKYELITPTGELFMAAALRWQIEQEKLANAKIFAQPAQCAQNISKVMRIAGFPSYTSPLVPGLLKAIENKGGLIVPLPKNRSAIAKVIAETFGNKIPTGTLVGGCLYKDCSGEAGDGHIAMVGDLDSNGAVKLYHNNWYRPDNENGVWKPQMIPLSWYKLGFKRKFMSTSWMNIFRDPPRVGTAYDVSIEVPAIDDLDPTNYYVTLAVPAEVWTEYKNQQGKVLDREGNQVPMEN